MSPEQQTRIVRQVAEEWMAEGRLSLPGDETDEDEQAFWAEVERRLAAA